MVSFGEVMERNRGVGPGFDFLRLFLATSIVLWHSVLFTGVPMSVPPMSTIFPLVVLLIPLFFGLSGFLVTGSLIRLKTLRPFIAFRALRILPALVVEVTLSALLLGPLVTEIALSEYFTDSKFWKYFGSIVGLVQFKLPGVFLHNPIPEIVNGQLWTVPPEMACYLTLSVLLVLGLATRPHVMLSLVTAAGFLVVARQSLFEPGKPFSYSLLAILQQLSVWFFPGQSWWENFAIGYCVTTGFAAISWHWIEKPALSLRKVIAPNRVLERPVAPDEAPRPSSEFNRSGKFYARADGQSHTASLNLPSSAKSTAARRPAHRRATAMLGSTGTTLRGKRHGERR